MLGSHLAGRPAQTKPSGLDKVVRFAGRLRQRLELNVTCVDSVYRIVEAQA